VAAPGCSISLISNISFHLIPVIFHCFLAFAVHRHRLDVLEPAGSNTRAPSHDLAAAAITTSKVSAVALDCVLLLLSIHVAVAQF
jgi:hypothetical protein